jgi:hypothetical protein
MSNVVIKEYLSHKIIFTDDGWLNATQTAKNFGKDVRGYTRSEQYKGYVNAVAKHLNCDVQNLHIAKKGGNLSEVEQGTFLHPKLAIDFARWISPDFAVWCDEQVANILNKKVFPQSFPEALRLYADEVEKNQLLEEKNKKLIKDYDILEDKAFDNWELFRLYLRPTKDDFDRLDDKKKK